MRRRGFWRSTAGASTLEFAILAVPLLLLIVGTLEYGRLLWTRQAMQSLAISTARCMGVLQTGCATAGAYSATKTRTLVVAKARSLGVGLNSANVTLNANTTCGGVTGFATVNIQYQFVSAAPHFITSMLVGPSLAAAACFPNQS